MKAALDAVLDYAGSSRVKDYSVTLSANGWDDYETPYTQSISHPMINADSAVLVAVASSATDAQFEAACAACLRFDSLAGALYARAYGTLPEVDIPLKIGVIV